jgi:F420-dependent oxidoreductase-like protein
MVVVRLTIKRPLGHRTEGPTHMRLGVSISNYSFPVPAAGLGAAITHVARTADVAGIDSLWVMDHLFQIGITGEPPEAPMLEGYSTLAYLAGQTERITLGTCVSSVAYRHPGVLIKIVTSLDVLSSGRMVLGVGAGAPWNELPAGIDPRDVEIAGLGIPFPSLAERFERLEELLQIAHQMWAGDERPYDGRHYQLARPLNSPQALQEPHPPIMIGGSGERKTLRLVARYADACNLFDLPGTGFRDDLRHKLEVLRQHCHDVGRDVDEIEITTATALELGADPAAGRRALLAHLRELRDLGVHHAIVSPTGPWSETTLDAVTSIVDDVHALG